MTPLPAYDVARANAPFAPALLHAAQAVMAGDRLILGDALERFERGFADACGTAHCVGVGNGLDALTLALRAAGVGPGDEVVVPAFTFVATWFAVTACGARPVGVDVTPAGLLDPALLESAIGPRTAAIVPVHLFGALADMAAIATVAGSRGILVIEDAAQAHGAPGVGARSAAAAFSFYPTKNLGALGDGGAVCTGDASLAARVRRLGNYGSAAKYDHVELGGNSRLDTIQAAFLSVKLPHLAAGIARRKQIAARYRAGLALPGVTLPADDAASVWHQFVVRSPARDWLRAALDARGVGTLVHYPVAPFDQPCFAGQYDAARFPVAAALAGSVLSLPMADYLTDAEVDRVIDAVRDAHG